MQTVPLIFSDQSSGDVDYGGPGEMFSSDEDDTDCTSERAIYPSEESSSDAFSVMTAKSAPAGEVRTMTDNEDRDEDHPELQRIGRLLIRKYCSKLYSNYSPQSKMGTQTVKTWALKLQSPVKHGYSNYSPQSNTSAQTKVHSSFTLIKFESRDPTS